MKHTWEPCQIKHILRQTALRDYVRKLLLTVDEFMALLEEC